MLVERWGGWFHVPADVLRFPHRCYHIDEEDWRYLLRFRTAGRSEYRPPENSAGRFKQDTYRFDDAGLRALLAAAEPYKERTGAA